ncbi:MFS transporter [Synechococcus sp. RedBA-s]|uniref:MFS transporter n=1 Tax=Synechococcus sp. RedBA-s TaxID=2823741 RepID=UPI0020CD8D68|nr:MFS transporter [Synechococcus sp. RedBA-s]MCP9800157.1 MFS transporter [Synechococcus sp. RedBA-s]
MSQVPSSPIRWRLAWGVVVLQMALLLGWMIYRAYQPELLSSHGFSQLLLPFALLPGLLGLVIEPLAGWLSDRRDPSARGRLLPVSVAVLVAGLIFLGVVGLLQQGIPAGSLLLPLLMVAWMVAVQSSASPALAVLREAAPLHQLPRVAALFTCAQGLLGALESPFTAAALRLGPALTFALGAAVLALGLAVLRRLPPFPPSGGKPPTTERVPPSQALHLLSLALAVGVVTGSLLTLLPRVSMAGAPASAERNVAAVVLIVSALVAPWGGELASRWGKRRCLKLGLTALAALLTLALLGPAVLLPVLLPPLGLAHSLVVTSLTATALATLPASRTGLGAGLVLGGVGVAGTLLSLVFNGGGPVAAGPLLAVVAVATALALVVGQRLPSQAGHRGGQD